MAVPLFCTQVVAGSNPVLGSPPSRVHFSSRVCLRIGVPTRLINVGNFSSKQNGQRGKMQLLLNQRSHYGQV